jgi:hypothetical protein
MHLKVFVKLKKTLKTLSSGQKKPKKPQKKQKKTKNPKNPKKTHWARFFFKKKPWFFPTLRRSTHKYTQESKLPDFWAAPAGHWGQQALEAGLAVGPIVLRQQDARVRLLHQQYLTLQERK